MSLGDEHLRTPMMRHGMDHDRYAWSMLAQRPPVRWPGGKTLALWVHVGLQYFPLNPSAKIKVPGSMSMPYPDLRHYTLRDYGNRVGIYRFLDAFDRYGVVPTFAINGRLAERAPYLMRRIRERGDEVIAHSWSMDATHAGGVDEAQEREWVTRTLAVLRETFERPVRGWVSPGKLESGATPELLAEQGIEYFCDWVNDDMPYRFRTARGALWAMPLSTELEDRFVIAENLHAETSYVEQVLDAAQFLIGEAREQGGRILSLALHPWVLGQPHRIGPLETILRELTAREEVWSASAGDILDAFVASQATQGGTDAAAP